MSGKGMTRPVLVLSNGALSLASGTPSPSSSVSALSPMPSPSVSFHSFGSNGKASCSSGMPSLSSSGSMSSGGLDHNSAQDQARTSVIGVGELGRISEFSYSWKCKLTEGSERCPKILPQETLAQMAGIRHPPVSGRQAAVHSEAPGAPGAGGAPGGRRRAVGAGTTAAAGGK